MSIWPRSRVANTRRIAPTRATLRTTAFRLAGDRSLNAVWTYETPFESMTQIKDYVAFYPDRVDEIS
jgi:uncharacterized protein (DUF427 family)